MKLLRLTACLSMLTSSAMAGISAGRGEISLDATATGTYDSNVSGRSGGQDDVYGTFAPRISYTRRAGRIGADASIGVSSERYVDHKEFNSDNLMANASLRLSEKSYQNIAASISANYSEGYEINPDLNARIKSHTNTFNGALGLVTGPRTRFDAQAGYSNSHRTAASDQQFFNGGLDFAYSGFMDDTALHGSYTYTESKSSGQNLRGADIDQNSHEFSLGLSRPLYHDVNGRVNYGYRILNRSAAETTAGVTRTTGAVFSASVDGPFLPARMFPKIKSHASISYEDAATPGVNDPGSKQISGDIGLTWQARETTSFSIGATRSQRLSANDLTVVTSDAHFSVDQKLRYNLSATAEVGYTWNTYKGITRSDQMLLANAALNYTMAHHWSASASYRYQSTSSDVAVADFARRVAILSLSYSY